MSHDPFRPFETNLDHDSALAMVRDATNGADDGELFLERRRSEVLSFDDGRIRTASYDASEGFGLRAVRGEVAGYAHSTTIDESALRRAVATTQLAVGAGGGTLADAPPRTNTVLYTDADPMAEATFPAKIDLLKEIDAFCRDLDPRVVQVSATLAASHQEVVILRPEGTLVTDTRPMSRLNISVIVEQDGRRESGGMGGGGRAGLIGLTAPSHWQPVAREALRIALVNLDAEPAPAGVMDVLLGPGWPGILLHEAVGHGLEGDFNRKGTSAFAGLMGQQVAARGVTVLDDGLHAGPPECAAHGRGPNRQRAARKLRPYSNAPYDQYLYAGRRCRPQRHARGSQRWHLRRRLWRWSGRYHQRKIRVQLHRGLPRQERQGRRTC